VAKHEFDEERESYHKGAHVDDFSDGAPFDNDPYGDYEPDNRELIGLSREEAELIAEVRARKKGGSAAAFRDVLKGASTDVVKLGQTRALQGEASAEAPECAKFLTPREAAACRLKANGWPRQAIADHFGVTPSTITLWTTTKDAVEFIAWLTDKMNALAVDQSALMQRLGYKALERYTDILYDESDDSIAHKRLVADVSKDMLNRTFGKPVERVQVESRHALTSDDIRGLGLQGSSLDALLSQAKTVEVDTSRERRTTVEIDDVGA
jgi:hypothetical protein